MTDVRIGHSRMGIASFVLSFFPGLLFALTLVLVSLAMRAEDARGEPLIEGAGWAFMVLSAVYTVFLSEVIALVLGVVGVVQRRRKRLFALLGVASSVLVLAGAYFQSVIFL